MNGHLFQSAARVTLAALLCAPPLHPSPLQEGNSPEQRVQAKVIDSKTLDHWRDARFGMFIHWGPVSQTGQEIGWSRGKITPAEEYDALPGTFNPVEFDADRWVRVAKQAGMNYIVLTTKHHDGFCLWDSAVTDSDMAATPFKRDVVRELAEACEAAELEFGIYYSILDWSHPDYNTTGAHGGPAFELDADQTPDMDRFQDYMEAQLRELVDRCSTPLTFWFDGEWEEAWTQARGRRLFEFCRELVPHTLINNRVGKDRQGLTGTTSQDSTNPGDYDTPERTVGAFNDERPWETCITLCQQWSWKPNDPMKSLKECVRTLVTTAGGDGNLLLNVGPMPNGRIEARQAERLREIGSWLEEKGESIYKTRGGPFYSGEWGASTHQGDQVYVHILETGDGTLRLPAIERRVLSAQVLGVDGVEGRVRVKQTENGLTLSIPQAAHDPLDTIVVLRLDGPARGSVKDQPGAPDSGR